MSFLLLIIATGLSAPAEGRCAEAIEVFHCTFDVSHDKDFDGWPDGWTRRHGPGFPHYTSIKISEDAWPGGDRCLRIEPNGGGAVALSPPIPVDSSASFVLEGYLKTEGLTYDRACFSVALIGDDRQQSETFCSEKIQTTQGWQKIRLGPFAPGNSETRWAIIGLHVEPQSGEDYRGAALFADIWLGRLPRMSLKTSDLHNLFTNPQAVEIACTVAGVVGDTPEVIFQLEDALGHPLAESRQAPSTEAIETRSDTLPQGRSQEPAQRLGTAQWNPPIPGAGFYRVRASLSGRQAPTQHQELTLAVVEPCRVPAQSEFGWSLPQGDKPLPLPALQRLIGQAGVGWVKYPFWYDQAAKAAEVDSLIDFAERLAAQGIQLVGLLNAPPPSLRPQLGTSGTPSAAEIFARSPKAWYPSLETVMTRLGTQIRWWQLGHDRDMSFVGYPDLPTKIAQIKSELDRIGSDVNVGMGWSWLSPPPQTAGNAPWRFLSLSAESPLSSAEMAGHFDAWKNAKFRRWIVLQPLPRQSQTVQLRAADLAERMLAAKVHGADAIFCPNPFDPDCGLMQADGTPGELLLPWRTTALALAGAKYLGSIALPGGSPNYVFARGQDALMVVWNDKPTEEPLDLGENLQQTDVWGRHAVPATVHGRQVVRVDRLPTFLSGLSEPIARWHIDFKFAHERIPSVFGRPHENSLCVRNPFPGEVAGRATLVVPDGWKIAPKAMSFRLGAGEQWQQPLEITLPFNADSGRQPVRVDFEIHHGEHVRLFSVYRWIEVGLGEVYIEVATRLSEQGHLEVVQRFINQSEQRVSFLCELYAPDRRRLATQVSKLGRGQDAQVYSLPDGKQLLGKTLWLRAGERDGPRTFNYRFAAKQ